MSVTIRQIAERAFVSEGTVDRALNNRPGISEKTKKRILEIAQEMDYRPNILAQSLATGSTKTIGVICAGLKNNFFTALIEAIEDAARKQGYYISLILTHGDPEQEMEGIHYLARRQVDGIIIFPVGCGKTYERELKNLKVPIVTVYNRISCDFTHVDVDCRKIMKAATERILDRGYENVVYPDIERSRLEKKGMNAFSLDQRRLGYQQAMEQSGVEPSYLLELQEEKLLKLAQAPEKTAILCPYDVIAIWLLDFYRHHGVSVPEDIGIMGFDNIDMLANITPRISSVDCHTRELGSTAVSILLEKREGTYHGGDVVIGFDFTEGDSI